MLRIYFLPIIEIVINYGTLVYVGQYGVMC